MSDQGNSSNADHENTAMEAGRWSMPLRDAELVGDSRHSACWWSRPPSYAFAIEDCFAPIALTETMAVALRYPIALQKVNGHFVPGVVLDGLARDGNRYVDDSGSWKSDYVPAIFRSYPFSFEPVDPAALPSDSFNWAFDQVDLTLALTIAVGNTVEASDESPPSGCEPFFIEGQSTKLLKETLSFLKKVSRDIVKAELIGTALWNLGLLQPLQVDGFYSVDGKALQALKGEALERLHSSGGIRFAHLQLASMQNFKRAVQPQLNSEKDSEKGSRVRRESRSKDNKTIDQEFLNAVLADVEQAL